MKNELLSSLRSTIKNWWASLIIGILAIVVGIWVLVTPATSFVALIYVFVVAFLIAGIFEIAFALSNRQMTGWGWSLAGGIMELLLGILLLFLPPDMLGVIMVYLVGFWILFRSIWAIGDATELQRFGVKGWGWLLTLAILSIIFSFIFLLSPAFGGIFVVVFVGIALIFYGIFRIALAIDLQSINKELKKIEGLVE